MHIDALRTFILVAELLNFSAAARQLGLPRGTVSARIQELEKRLGVRLFQRSNRQVALTPEGVQYLASASPAVTLLDEAQNQLAATHEIAGPIRVGYPAATPDSGLLAKLSEFCRQHPKVNIELVLSDQAVDLVEARIDLSIRGRDPANPDLIARPLRARSLLLVASPAWLAQHQPITHWQHLPVHDPHRQASFPHQTPDIHTSDLNTSLQLCLNGLGAAVLPALFCRPYLERGELISLTPPEPLPELSLFLIYPQRKLLPERTRRLIQTLLD
ncbi:LysR family transcriptional regulator [Photobacterium sp. TY1-4]|uniref:LysR family transcriptional regulator n=1 Tax=Photobacterium sp. TY1-4 TaxID=2899122 RepID=UPI0021C21371|nr:LysR family transcriptional regulator [Photobacterium sp. TY1-4]UXI03500.1 LysR family transcriptional regulator [Photobacterium sp. TY1-4]